MTLLLQRSLFPDAFEVEERAFAALDELDLPRAARLVAEARERDPALVNLEPLAAALAWLLREAGAEPVSDELLALLFLSVPAACASGEITPAAAALIDAAIARQGLHRTRSTRPFLDDEACVHRGSLLLVLGRASEAFPLLGESLRGREERADLWASFGDACFALERFDEANAAFVRALVLAAREVDLLRLRHPGLAALRDELVPMHGEPCARELLLVHAWLAGTLTIPPENGWLDRQLSRLHLAATLRPDSTREQRLRRFTLLFYLDRSRLPGHCDDAEREEMHSLEPELFARILERVHALEKRQTKPLRW